MADKKDIAIDAGATYESEVVLSNDDGSLLNLTNYTARMFLKRSYNDAVAEKELTTENGLITIDAVHGKLTIEIPAEDTRLLGGTYVYDLKIESEDGFVLRLFQGQVLVSPEVTR